MAEKTALTDPKSLEWKEVPAEDAYADGMSVEDAYRYLAGVPMTPINVGNVPSK